VAASADRFRLLYELGLAFAAQTELDELVPVVVTRCREALDAEGVALLLHDRARDELYFPWVAEEDPAVAARLRDLRLPADRGIAGAVLRDGKALRIDDAAADPRFYPEIDRGSGLTTRAVLAVPLAARRGTIGVLEVVNRSGGGTFDDDDLGFLGALAGSVAMAVENAQLYGEVKGAERRLRTEVAVLRRDLARHDRFSEMVGSGPAMAEVFRLMESAAASPITVLIEGETGTGKELVARGIHRASARADGPFLAVNCAAVPETLLESELFGHRRGAFTGALQDRAGVFEAATGGTIFLDEVGDMPAAMQAKLLRVLQEGEVTPIGETRPRKVDVRVISATNRDLDADVAANRFRQDLYFRLAAFPIQLPPLRARREDVPVLADRMLAAAAERHTKRIPGIEAATMERLVAFEWPGNVRELQNEIERAVALARDGEPVGLAHLSRKLVPALPPQAAATDDGPGDAAAVDPKRAAGTLRHARAEFEKRYLAEVLRRHGGNVSHAARALGLSRVMLQKKMKEYRLR
jgi:Nif-specific regulatory protein